MVGRADLENNSITKVMGFLRRLILYQEPTLADRFVLKENEYYF